VAAAKRAGVAHVRIQTNATRLHDRGLLESLLTSGVDEFFVSLHGADAATCDRITQRNGSFKAIVAGLRAIAASGARLVTNTAICQQNYTSLTSIVELAVAHQAAEVEFWNLWPRIDPEDLRGHLVPVAQAAPHLVAALDRAEELGRPATVKWFPRCLLGGRAIKLDNSQPNVLIEQEFWQDAPTYGCIHADTCAAAKDLTCLGLSKQYVDKYGWEAAALKPL
jgi:cyclic pyranopterin phosphate synthase